MSKLPSPPPFDLHKDGIRIRVRVTPKSSKNTIDGLHIDGAGHSWLKVKVTAAPEDGKANKSVIRQLSKALGHAPTEIRVLSGETTRQKTLLMALPEKPVGKRTAMTKKINELLGLS